MNKLIPYIATAIAFLLGSFTLLIDKSPFIKRFILSRHYKTVIVSGMFLFLGLTALDLYNQSIEDRSNQKEKAQLKTQIIGLTNNIDTIKESVKQYSLTVVGNKVIPVENNITINNAQNAVGINNGQIENNQTRIDNSQKFQIIDTSKSYSTESPEIQLINLPTLKKFEGGFNITYPLKTKNEIEAHYVADEFTWIYRKNGTLFHYVSQPRQYFKNNKGIITNSTKNIIYTVILEDPTLAFDTCYLRLSLTYKNRVEQKQLPFNLTCRISLRNGLKVTRLNLGKEYEQVIDYITTHDFIPYSDP